MAKTYTKAKGHIVEFLDKDERTIKGHAYHLDQSKVFAEQGKVVVREINSDGIHLIKNGREVVHIKNKDDVKTIGFLN